MSLKKESEWKKYISIIKDAVFVIGILISCVGWYHSETVKSTQRDIQIQILTKELNDNTKQLEKINDILSDQKTLNGEMIEYMKR